MNLPEEAGGYKNAEVLVLGSGDGSLLFELLSLKNPPKKVTMVDLDEEVLKGCGLHMQKACGPHLNQRKGSNFEILVGDAVEYLKDCVIEKKTYDYVFSDLTDMPVCSEDSDAYKDQFKFLLEISKMAVQLVKPGTGKLMSHCNRKTLPKFITTFENMLKSLTYSFDKSYKPVVKRRDSFVPSFVGTWVFFYLTMTKS